MPTNTSISEMLVDLGYARKDVEDSLNDNRYDDITATYLLLALRQASAVSRYLYCSCLYSRFMLLYYSKTFVIAFLLLTIHSIYYIAHYLYNINKCYIVL